LPRRSGGGIVGFSSYPSFLSEQALTVSFDDIGTPLGNVVNRNSKDTEILDTEQVENLQPVLDYSVQVLFVAGASLASLPHTSFVLTLYSAVVIAAVLPIFFIPASFIFLVFFLIANLYIRSALAARKQVSSSRSPLFSTLGDTTSGVVTIRAFGREQAFAERYKLETDRYNQAQLYEEGLDRWLEERSDTVGAAVSFVVGILCLSSGLSSGVTGFLISTGTSPDISSPPLAVLILFPRRS
jgi:ABC-type multidrug transport system fused ATPase/permease subunit